MKLLALWNHRCVAHTLSLCLKSCYADASEVIESCKNFVKYLNQSTQVIFFKKNQ
jgi:hypothetical protein